MHRGISSQNQTAKPIPRTALVSTIVGPDKKE